MEQSSVQLSAIIHRSINRRHKLDMARQQQEKGWPLGLHPLNGRVIELSSSSTTANNGGGGDGGGAVSFNTLLSVSPDNSSTDSSSDLDSQTTTGSSFFHERITTFRRLIGASSTLHLSKRSTNRRTGSNADNLKRNSGNSKLWFFSVWCRSTSDVEVVDSTATPLSHFLAADRRSIVGPYYDGVGLLCHSTPESNSLFVDGRIAPPRPATACPWLTPKGGQSTGNSSVLLSWICGPK